MSSVQSRAPHIGSQPAEVDGLRATNREARTLGVDLDGTLLSTDSLWECILVLIKHKPKSLLRFPRWLLGGKAFFKRQVAGEVELDPAHLPYRKEVIAFLQKEKASGKDLVLASAADERIVKGVAGHLGLFSAVLASDGVINLSRAHKLRALQRYTGGEGFAYIGNSRDDLPLWGAAEHAILVGPSPGLLRKARRVCSAEHVIVPQVNSVAAWVDALRVHRWAKNLLLFVPLLAAQEISDPARILKEAAAVAAFSLCASGVYIIADLANLESDRQDARKRSRPFACGALQLQTGIVLAIFLLAGALLIAALVTPALIALLLSYAVMAVSCSLGLGRRPLVDVALLAGINTLRIVAGAVAGEVAVNSWLLAGSVLLFLSLGWLARYAQLSYSNERTDHPPSGGQGYALRWASRAGFLRSWCSRCPPRGRK